MAKKKYSIKILGTLADPKIEEIVIEVDKVTFKKECIVFTVEGDDDPVLVIPQNCSIMKRIK